MIILYYKTIENCHYSEHVSTALSFVKIQFHLNKREVSADRLNRPSRRYCEKKLGTDSSCKESVTIHSAL